MKQLAFVFGISIGLTACDSVKQTVETPQTEPVDQPINEVNSDFGSQTIDRDFLNLNVKPQDDFFQFSNGNWIKNNPVPASESRWGSFNELDQANKEKIKLILNRAANTQSELGSRDQLLGAYYTSYVNMTARNEAGLKPIQDDLELINKITSKSEIPALLAIHHRNGIRSLFGFGVGQDIKHVEQHVVSFRQGGIGLPNRDYYFKEDKAEIRSNYHLYISEVLRYSGLDQDVAGPESEFILQFEIDLAAKMMTPTEMRDPEKTYNKYHVRDAISAAGSFPLDQYIKATGISKFDSLIIGQPEFLKNLDSLYESVSLENWKSYLRWKVLNHYSDHLNDDLLKLNFGFYGTVLSGKKELKPIEDRAIDEMTRIELSELLGQAFVNQHFSDAAQQRVNRMVDDLLFVFEERISALEWMSPVTKKEAIHKLKSIGRKLGFPQKWQDFSSLAFNSRDYFINVRMMANFEREKNLEKLNQPVDKSDWSMPAHMVNAYYHPLLNEIVFPAGIMQAPFFSEQYEDAVNYGRIGMVIGHEFTHGFDDKGSKFAADGTFKNWWLEEDRKLFEDRTKTLGNTYETFCPVEGHCVNPQLTMGENIADLGGLTLAYYAYTRTDEFKSGIVRDGFTPAQRFFIAYAQLWRINYTEAELKNRLATDSHSPGMYRVNGPLMNCPEFFEAFGVKEGDPMRNPASKIAKIW